MEESEDFVRKIDNMLEAQPGFHPRAYCFLRSSMDYTFIRLKKQQQRPDELHDPHVNGEELSWGFRDHALELYGPLALHVMEKWRIKRSEDVGTMVYQLIELGIFGKKPEDELEDFAGHWSTEQAFAEFDFQLKVEED